MLNKRKATNMRSHIEGFHLYKNNWNKWRHSEERTWGGSEKTLGTCFTWWNVPELEVVLAGRCERPKCHWVIHSTRINFNLGLATYTSNFGTWKAEPRGLLQILGQLELQNVAKKIILCESHLFPPHFFNAIPQPMNSAWKPSLSPRFPPQIWTLDAWLLTKGEK